MKATATSLHPDGLAEIEQYLTESRYKRLAHRKEDREIQREHEACGAVTYYFPVVGADIYRAYSPGKPPALRGRRKQFEPSQKTYLGVFKRTDPWFGFEPIADDIAPLVPA